MSNESYAPIYGNYDRNSIIERLDASKNIPIIVEHLLGIRIVNSRSGAKVETNTVRFNQPTFTEEFVRMVEHQLNGYVNSIFTFSRFEPEAIQMRIRNIGKSITRLFALTGNDHFISENSWKRIMAIHDKKWIDPKDKTEKSGWCTPSININWDYNKPVTMEMLSLVKDFDEDCDQDIIFEQISHQMRRMIDASYRRSSSLSDELGMMTSVLAGTTQERNVTSSSQQVEQQPPLPNDGSWR